METAPELRAPPVVTPVPVRLGRVGAGSISASLLVQLRAGVANDPALARSLRCRVRIDPTERYTPVLIEFAGDRITVGDGTLEDECDLVLEGSIPDLLVLACAPTMSGGIPKVHTAAGRQAISRLVDGRVEVYGPLRLALKLVRLLAIQP